MTTTRRRGFVWRFAAVGLLLIAVAGNRSAPATAQSNDPEWLQWLNYYRAVGGLELVTHNPDFDLSVQTHAEYLIDLDQEGLCDAHPHCEAIPPGSALGDDGAQNVISRATFQLTGRDVVENLIGAPFHALSMLRPGLSEVGFGLYTNLDASPSVSAGVINVNSDPAPTDVSRVFTWPADGAVIPLGEYSGNETPDPLVATSCDDLDFPRDSSYRGDPLYAGLPIIVRNAPSNGVDAIVTDVTTGAVLTSCVATAADYPADSPQAAILTADNAFFVIPEQGLEDNRVYRVTVSGPVTLDFSFGVIPPPDSPPDPADARPGVDSIPTTVPTTVPTTDPTTGSTPPGSAPPTSIPTDTVPVVRDTPSTGIELPSADRLGWFAWIPLLVGVVMTLVAAAMAIRRAWSDEVSASVALIGVAIGLLTPLVTPWTEIYIGATHLSYRGVDWLGPSLVAIALIIAIGFGAVRDLAARRRPGSLVKGALLAVLVLSGSTLLTGELVAALSPIKSTLLENAADAAPGTAPWAAFFTALVGLAWAYLPARGGLAVLLKPFGEMETTGQGVAAGVVAAVGITAVIWSRYMTWVSADVLGFDIAFDGRSVPVAATAVPFGLALMLVGFTLVGCSRAQSGLLIGGMGTSLIVVPAAVATATADTGLRFLAPRLERLSQQRFAAAAPDLDITHGPAVMFVGGLLCAVALIAVGWGRSDV